MTIFDCAEIAARFQFDGRFLDAAPLQAGHINDTFVARFEAQDGSTRRGILQRINQNVFRDPAAVMENVQRVTLHLRGKVIAAGGDPERETLNLIPARDGANPGGGAYFRDPAGDYWRAYRYIEGAHTYETAENPRQVYNAAWAFGHFQHQMADFPASLLHDTIPNFHNTPSRFAAFQDALGRDPAQRAAAVTAEIDFILAREADTRVLVEGIARGDLPLRVTHNDTKLNNVMIDDQTGQAICVVDLDTVMPGLALYDFGDAVRSAAALSVEDEPDSARAGFSLETFDHLARGYLDAARGFLTPAETDLLAFSARLITLEQAIRFLGDYLNGDTYYKIHRPGHNLDRARTQIKMLSDMEERFAEMQAIVERYR